MPAVKLSKSVRERKKERQEDRTPAQLLRALIVGDMEAMGVTQMELSRRLGVSPSTVCNYLQTPEKLGLDKILAIADALYISNDRLRGIFPTERSDVEDMRASIAGLYTECIRLRNMLSEEVTT